MALPLRRSLVRDSKEYEFDAFNGGVSPVICAPCWLTVCTQILGRSATERSVNTAAALWKGGSSGLAVAGPLCSWWMRINTPSKKCGKYELKAVDKTVGWKKLTRGVWKITVNREQLAEGNVLEEILREKKKEFHPQIKTKTQKSGT